MSKRGGARAGSGKKPISKKYSDALKIDLFNALGRKAKETGKTIGDIIADLAYNSDSQNFNVRPIALKMIQEILLIRETQSTSEINVQKSEMPVIGLPPIQEPKSPPGKVEESQEVALH